MFCQEIRIHPQGIITNHKAIDDFAAFTFLVRIGVNGDRTSGLEIEIYEESLLFIVINCIGFYPESVERYLFAFQGLSVDKIDVFHTSMNQIDEMCSFSAYKVNYFSTRN